MKELKDLPRNYIVQPDGSFKPVRRRTIIVLRDADTYEIVREINSEDYWTYQRPINEGKNFDVFPDNIWIYEEI